MVQYIVLLAKRILQVCATQNLGQLFDLFPALAEELNRRKRNGVGSAEQVAYNRDIVADLRSTAAK